MIYDRYEVELEEARQTNKRLRRSTASNDSGMVSQINHSYDHLIRSSGISTDNDEQTSQQMQYTAHLSNFATQPPQVFNQATPQPAQTFLQSQQSFSRPSQFQNFPQSPQQQYVYQSSQGATSTIQRISPPIDSESIIVDESFRIVDEKPILEKLEKMETQIAKLDGKFDILIKATAERASHENRLAEMIENFHRDFQVWKEIANEDAFSTEFSLPLKNADDVENFEKKLASDNAFRIVMVNFLFIFLFKLIIIIGI